MGFATPWPAPKASVEIRVPPCFTGRRKDRIGITSAEWNVHRTLYGAWLVKHIGTLDDGWDINWREENEDGSSMALIRIFKGDARHSAPTSLPPRTPCCRTARSQARRTRRRSRPPPRSTPCGSTRPWATRKISPESIAPLVI